LITKFQWEIPRIKEQKRGGAWGVKGSKYYQQPWNSWFFFSFLKPFLKNWTTTEIIKLNNREMKKQTNKKSNKFLNVGLACTQRNHISWKLCWNIVCEIFSFMQNPLVNP
jgi:hypothetical protein